MLLADLNEDAKRVAARVYLKGSHEVDDPELKAVYPRIAKESLSMQTVTARSITELRLQELEATFRKELAEAENWYGNIRNDELAWIEAGVNEDEEFTMKYYLESEVGALPSSISGVTRVFIAVAVAVYILVSGASGALYARRIR